MFTKNKTNVKEQKGVYYIKNDKEEIIYVGYTNASFSQRWTNHINNAISTNNKAQKKLYEYLYNQLKNDKHIYFGVLITAEEIKSLTGQEPTKENLESWEKFFISRLTPRFNVIDNVHLKNSFNEHMVLNMAKKEYNIKSFTYRQAEMAQKKINNKHEERIISTKSYAVPFKQAITIEPIGRAKVEQNRMRKKQKNNTLGNIV